MENMVERKYFSKELQLLLFILDSKIDDKNLSNEKERFRDINWDHFLQLTLHHRVYPILYTKLKGINCSLIPAKVLGKLQHYYQKNIFQMLMLTGESESISSTFIAEKIRTIFLKGSTLGEYLYGDLSLRTSSDIDILIPIEDLERAEMTLLKLGYVKDDYILTVLNDWKWRHHHITFIHPQKKIKVEIHWRLNPGPSWNPSFEDLWERKNKSTITDIPLYMLGKEDLFVFLVSHGARHGWSRLRWLVDIDRLVSKDLNWNAIKSLLKKYHLTAIGGQALFLSSELLNSDSPHELKGISNSKRSKRLAEGALFYIKQLVNLHVEPLPEEIANYHKSHLFLLMSFKQKVLFILSFLYPYPEDAQALPLPKALHFLYFPLRPFLWVIRRKRKQALLQEDIT
ncbi:nucleotidyltransferase family protein [Mesobacillus sp. AQ2]|uniref:nucleotidyltransferase domain-containing protein n=1 Tax=Mesobacillus sp. AQ2 TaxID=3043332 RepID=UPI0024C1BED3|nr:nucleotidyltransferase family protein [Mesobacillus sp. AQ2]WHX41408.1 nucleotidyltransferase family protein [Mesobacillus sp. AQ2]